MADEERPKIDEDLKKEILASKKADQMDISERAAALEGKIPTKPKEEDK